MSKWHYVKLAKFFFSTFSFVAMRVSSEGCMRLTGHHFVLSEEAGLTYLQQLLFETKTSLKKYKWLFFIGVKSLNILDFFVCPIVY